MEFRIKIRCMYFRVLHDCSFTGEGFYYNLNSLSENMSRNDQDIFKKRGMHFIHIYCIQIDLCQKVRNIVNITNASVNRVSETKLDEIILSSGLEVDGYDLIRLDRPKKGGGVFCHIKSSIGYRDIVTKTIFAVTSKESLLTFVCLSLNQSYWVSYMDHPINQISLNTLIMFSQNLGF